MHQPQEPALPNPLRCRHPRGIRVRVRVTLSEDSSGSDEGSAWDFCVGGGVSAWSRSVAVDINVEPFAGKASVSLSLDVNARRWQPVQLDIALAGGISLLNPTANYFYTSVVLEVDVKTALCKFGDICRSLPDAVSKFLAQPSSREGSLLALPCASKPSRWLV